jgi:hypothetical protein
MPEPEARHRACWYGRRTSDIPLTLGFHATIEDGELLFCAHPMWFPVVGYQFDVRNCETCDYFRGRAREESGDAPQDKKLTA